MTWAFVAGLKKHTEDGLHLVGLMKGIGHGNKPVQAIDVGCGDGIIAVEILNHKKATHVVAIDILDAAIEATKKNIRSKNLESQAVIQEISAQGFFHQKKNWHRFDRFVINPPFFAEGSGFQNKKSGDQLARHDRQLPLNVWTKGAKRLLKSGGELYCVYPTERLAELMMALKKNGIEPKNIWWINGDLRLRRVFLRGVRDGKPGLQVKTEFQI